MSETQRNIPAEAVAESHKAPDAPLSGEELRAKTAALAEGYGKRVDSLPNLKPADKERLKAEFKAFVLDSAANALSGSLSEYSASAADTDGEPWLDAYEFAKYSKGLGEAFRLVVESGGVDKLHSALAKFDADAKGSFFVKNFDLFSRHAPDSPDRPTNFVTEKYLESVSNLPPEETRRLLSAKLGDDPESFKKGLFIAIGTKAPVEVFEIAGRFAYDAVKAVPQFAEYASYAVRSSFADTHLAKKELSVKMRTILDDNAVVWLLALGSDSLGAVTNSLLGTDASSDGHMNRARELLHRMGNPMSWTPEGVKDVLLVLVPVLLKVRQIRNAAKNDAPMPPKSPEKQPPAAAPDLSKYDTPAKLSGLKKRLGLPEAATGAEIEKAYAERLSAALERYDKSGKENLRRVWADFVQRLRAKGVPNPEKVISDEIRSVREAYARGEIVVVHLHRNNPWTQAQGFLSPYELRDDPFAKMAKYGAERADTETRLGTSGLDPKYVAFLADRGELLDMADRYQATHVSTFRLEDFKGRAWVTMYDSMLAAKAPGWPDAYMFPLEEALTVRALKNVERKYDGVWYGDKMRTDAAAGLTGRMRDMYENMPDFLEIQVFGEVPYPKDSTVPIDELAKSMPKPPDKKR